MQDFRQLSLIKIHPFLLTLYNEIQLEERYNFLYFSSKSRQSATNCSTDFARRTFAPLPQSNQISFLKNPCLHIFRYGSDILLKFQYKLRLSFGFSFCPAFCFTDSPRFLHIICFKVFKQQRKIPPFHAICKIRHFSFPGCGYMKDCLYCHCSNIQQEKQADRQ